MSEDEQINVAKAMMKMISRDNIIKGLIFIILAGVLGAIAGAIFGHLFQWGISMGAYPEKYLGLSMDRILRFVIGAVSGGCGFLGLAIAYELDIDEFIGISAWVGGVIGFFIIPEIGAITGAIFGTIIGIVSHVWMFILFLLFEYTDRARKRNIKGNK